MKRTRSLKTCLLRLLAVAALMGVAEVAEAALPGEYFHLPAAGQKPKHGVRAVIDARWVDANGYRPVRVQISTTPPVPSKADRSFEIELDSAGWYGQVYQPKVVKTIELPEGATSVDAVLSIPQFQTWSSVELRMYENGRELKEMAFTSGISSNSVNQWSEASPTMLFIASAAPTLAQRESQVGLANGSFGNVNPNTNQPPPTLPDVRSLISLFAYNHSAVIQDYSLTPTSDLETLTFAARIQQLELLPPAELPDAWINYTCFDVIFVSLDELKRLSTAKRAALRDWTASGPTLVVYDVGHDYQRLQELERLLGLSRVDKADRLPWRGWSEPATADRGKTIRTLQGFSRNAGNGQFVFQNGQQVWTNNLDVNRPTGDQVKGTIYERRLDEAGKPPLFLVREAGFGRVLAFADNPFPGTIADWEWAFHTIGDTNWKWYQRNGTSLNRKNQHYWNWLVPGVGLPPVTSFLVLISVFVVVIGPVNYFVLQKMRRLYLLLVTVPLGAGIVTACLFSFALLTDGLGVKGRVRSVTLLDQTSQQAVSCSRQTYYAAIAPSRGLTFPETAAVYPLELSPYRISRSESRRRSISWDQQQNLRSGFIRSRTQNQFMVVHPHRSEAELSVKQSAGGDGAIEVTNHLGAVIEYLVIADSAGKLHYQAALATDASAKPRGIPPQELKDILTPVFGAARPDNPEYMDTTRYDDDSYGFSSSWYYDQRSSLDSDQPAASHLTSVLEVKLRDLVSRGFQIPARQYLAILRHSPEVPLGVAAMQEKQSFHVILGRY